MKVFVKLALVSNGKPQECLVKLSEIAAKYLKLYFETVEEGSQRSMYNNSKG